MYCYQRDKARAVLKPLHIVTKQLNQLFLDEAFPFKSFPTSRAVSAALDIMARWSKPNKKPEYAMPPVEIDSRRYVVEEKTVLEKPFCHLKKFEIENAPRQKPNILVVAPMSGHYATLVRDTIYTLLRDHVVYVTDWISAYNVEKSEGSFCLDSYVDYLVDFHDYLGSDVHVLAVCQPCVPVMMATALLAKQGSNNQPKSMILMGGPIDSRINPTEVNKMTQRFSLEWFEKNMVSEIPAYALGAGRRVTPGNLILAGFISMNLEGHIKKHGQYVFDAFVNKIKNLKAHREFYDEYLSVMDLPAEYFIQTVDKVFQRHLLPKGMMDYRGSVIDFGAIQKTALMTVEGENDDIAGIGQTYAAHEICSKIPETKRKHFLRLDVGHYGIFSGSRWRHDIYPQIRDFIAYHENI